jgi:hypothetical protein
MNRFGENTKILEQFLFENKTIGILKLDNLSLRKYGV